MAAPFDAATFLFINFFIFESEDGAEKRIQGLCDGVYFLKNSTRDVPNHADHL